MFPYIAVFASKFDVLQKVLSFRVTIFGYSGW